MDEDWDAALGYTRQFLARPERISAGKLSAGLLEPEILHKQGHTVLGTRIPESLSRAN